MKGLVELTKHIFPSTSFDEPLPYFKKVPAQAESKAVGVEAMSCS